MMIRIELCANMMALWLTVNVFDLDLPSKASASKRSF
jgi:hypothetical protein